MLDPMFRASESARLARMDRPEAKTDAGGFAGDHYRAQWRRHTATAKEAHRIGDSAKATRHFDAAYALNGAANAERIDPEPEG